MRRRLTFRQRLAVNESWHQNMLTLARETETKPTTGAEMKSVPDESPLAPYERMAEGLKQAMESTVVGTVQLIPDPPGDRPADRTGLPASITGEKSSAEQLEEARSEIAQLRAAQKDRGNA